MSQTKVEKEIRTRSFGQLLNPDGPTEKQQPVLDELTPIIMRYVSPQDLLDHNRKVYDATAKQYAENPHNQDVIDEIITFMNRLPNGARVLDVGCAWGRDACFMAYDNGPFRAGLMGRKDKNGIPTRERIPAPTKRFEVIGIDISLELLKIAQERARALGLSILFIYDDMHDIFISASGTYADYFDGVWSCTALFTHTPRVLLEPAIASVARVLKPGGMFFVSYTNGAESGVYDKLLASSTGHVKYFSRPDPREVSKLAKKHGLLLIAQNFSDYKESKNLFVSQFFKKVE